MIYTAPKSTNKSGVYYALELAMGKKYIDILKSITTSNKV